MKLPRQVSGATLRASLRRLGYDAVRQRGSHVRVTTQVNGTFCETAPAFCRRATWPIRCADRTSDPQIDVNFGSSAVMARAFVKVVRDMKLPRGDAGDPAAPAGFRDLAKEIRRRQATIVFEMFDDGTARRWVEESTDFDRQT